MKGVLICGGSGSRLKPLTDITNKSLLPVYDQPLIHYPLRVLRDAGITSIAVITGPEHIDQIADYLGSGSRFGCEFAFKVQERPEGIAQALGLAEKFVDGDDVCAILGDNVFLDDLSPVIRSFESGAHLFLKEVPDPTRFGVAEITEDEEEGAMRVTSLEEKPERPKSTLAATGCYLYDAGCFDIIRSLAPSQRGELEITDVSLRYLDRNELRATVLRHEWIDAGTFDSLLDAGNVVRARRAA